MSNFFYMSFMKLPQPSLCKTIIKVKTLSFMMYHSLCPSCCFWPWLINFHLVLQTKKRGKTQMISQGRPAIVSLSKRENRLISLKCEFQKPLRKKPASHFFQLVAFFTARAFMKYYRASKVKQICFFINLLNTFYLSLFFFFLILSDGLTRPLQSAFSDVCRRPNYQSTFFAHYLENFTMLISWKS